MDEAIETHGALVNCRDPELGVYCSDRGIFYRDHDGQRIQLQRG